MNTDISTARAGHFINDNRRWYLLETEPKKISDEPERWGFRGYNSDGMSGYWTVYTPVTEITEQAPSVFKSAALRRKADNARRKLLEQRTAIERAESLAALLAERERAARTA